LEAEIRRRVLAVPEYRQESSLLQKIPGIREDAAACIIAESGVRMEQIFIRDTLQLMGRTLLSDATINATGSDLFQIECD
jgi:hypothetical protein